MYSQNDEEKYIVGYFQPTEKRRRFLDIGAFDGKAFSNTYALVERGWAGVCVEPSPTVFYRLLELHRGNPNIELINGALDVGFGLKEFYDSTGDALSSFSKEHKTKWEQGWGSKFSKIYVSSFTAENLFNSFAGSFEFINLDVESHNFPLLQAILPYLNACNNKLICVEHDNHQNAIISMLQHLGYRKIMENGENIILGR